MRIEKERDQQLADLDRLLDGIERTSKEGEASEELPNGKQAPAGKGVGEALAFLEAKSSQRAELIEAQKNRRDREENELRKLLQRNFSPPRCWRSNCASRKPRTKYRKVVGDAGLWAERAKRLRMVSYPARHNGRTGGRQREAEEAAKICQGTLALNQRGEIASGLGP